MSVIARWNRGVENYWKLLKVAETCWQAVESCWKLLTLVETICGFYYENYCTQTGIYVIFLTEYSARAGFSVLPDLAGRKMRCHHCPFLRMQRVNLQPIVSPSKVKKRPWFSQIPFLEILTNAPLILPQHCRIPSSLKKTARSFDNRLSTSTSTLVSPRFKKRAFNILQLTFFLRRLPTAFFVENLFLHSLLLFFLTNLQFHKVKN